MAIRPVFMPTGRLGPLVLVKDAAFEWYPGFATSQKQKSIASLHEVIKLKKIGLSPLEISTKSPGKVGRKLSAFNLRFRLPDWPDCQVELAFQSSKCFERGGPYLDIAGLEPREAKRDPRLRQSGNLVAFEFRGERWGLEPRSLFYDWLYLNALSQNPALAKAVLCHDAFTDIEFNPKKSFNCQAHSAALYVSLARLGLLNEALENSQRYQALVASAPPPKASSRKPVQGLLF